MQLSQLGSWPKDSLNLSCEREGKRQKTGDKLKINPGVAKAQHSLLNGNQREFVSTIPTKSPSAIRGLDNQSSKADAFKMIDFTLAQAFGNVDGSENNCKLAAQKNDSQKIINLCRENASKWVRQNEIAKASHEYTVVLELIETVPEDFDLDTKELIKKLHVIYLCMKKASDWVDENEFDEADTEYLIALNEINLNPSAIEPQTQLLFFSRYARNLHRLEEWEGAEEVFQKVFEFPDAQKDSFTLSRHALFLMERSVKMKGSIIPNAQESFEQAKKKAKDLRGKQERENALQEAQTNYKEVVRQGEKNYQYTLLKALEQCQKALDLPHGQEDICTVTCYAVLCDICGDPKGGALWYRHALKLMKNSPNEKMMEKYQDCVLKHFNDLIEKNGKEEALKYLKESLQGRDNSQLPALYSKLAEVQKKFNIEAAIRSRQMAQGQNKKVSKIN